MMDYATKWMNAFFNAESQNCHIGRCYSQWSYVAIGRSFCFVVTNHKKGVYSISLRKPVLHKKQTKQD